MENNEKLYEPISNALCSDDLFEGKSHTTIAKNISNAIKKYDNCHMIGLDGGWGTGKSNLLKLVEKELNEKYYFFLYDAWGHQGDIQRRAILENLTSFVINNALVKKTSKWVEKSKNLIAKTRETEVKTMPKLSIGVLISIFTVILYPIFEPISKLLENHWTYYLVYSIPFITFLIFLIVYRFIQKSWKKAFNEIISFYTKDRQDIRTEEVISESIPSSRKFKEWMKDISDDLKDGNKLVIVFDNMDRLPANKVEELWASIHSFFSEETYPNIWVIVPFDRLHIRNAFKNENITDDNTLKNSYGDDFINKTFDIVYRVSPPTLVDWKQYFRKLWKGVFGENIDEGNYKNITQIYDLLSEDQSPRKIIAFINEFATIKQIVKDSVPEPYVALYIFGKDKIRENGMTEFFSPSFLGAIDFLYKEDEDFPKYLAALHYQLPPEKINDIVFTEKLKKALDNKDVDTVKSISEHVQFSDILENAIVQISNIPNAIECFDEVFKQTEKSSYIKHIWKSLYRKARNIQKEELQKFQIILLENIENPEKYLKLILSGFRNTSNFDSKIYYKNIQQLSEIDRMNVFEYLENKEVETDKFIEFVKLAKWETNQYKINTNYTKLDEYLSSLTVEDLKEATYIPYLMDKYTFGQYTKHIKDLIPENYDNFKYINTLYSRLKELERPVVKELLSDSQIYTLSNRSDKEEVFYYDLICMGIARFDNYNYRNYFDNVLERENDEFIEKIAERIEYYTTYGEILLNLSTMNYKWYKEIAKKLTEKSYGVSRLDILSILQDYNSIIENLKEYIDKETLINRLNRWSDYVKEKVTTDNISSIPLKFFEDIHQIESNELIEHCTTVTHNYLKQIAKEEWVKTIENQDFAYEVMKVMEFPIPQKAFEALQDIIFTFILEEQDCEEQIQYLLSKAQKEDKVLTPMFKNIRDKFTRGDVEMNTDIFNVLGKYLLEYGKLEEKEESLRTILNNEIADNFTDLLLNYITIIRNIIQKAGKEASNFTDHIKEQAKSNSAMEQLAKQLGIISQEDKDASNKNTENK